MLRFLYITNNEEVAKIVEKNGVEWIFVDLEILGKKERQKGKDTVISNHTVDDIKKLKNILTKSKILVRTNPINSNSKDEIYRIIENGADIIMLPFFKTIKEVEEFLKIVNSKTKTILLLETPESVKILEDLIKIKEINYFYIGLNDLSLGYGFKFMFEPLAYGIVDEIVLKIKKTQKEFGFGGIACLGKGVLPAEYVIAEHYRLGSTMVILSRSFCDVSKINETKLIEKIFEEEINKIREYEKSLSEKNNEFFYENKNKIKNIIIGGKNE
ncbi:MAG: aldolase/citrate lyase family protein [candidate division WOR-3 bacterium]